MKTSLSGPDAVDTRTLFRVYATCAAIAGIFLLVAPPGVASTLVADARPTRALLQAMGTCLVALGCLAAGFSEIEEPRSRHRALGCFAFGHLVALAGLVTLAVSNGGLHEGDVAVPILAGVCILLFYFWQTGDGYRAGESVQFTRLFGRAPRDEGLRSAYDERIREAAAQEERHRLARDLHDSVKQQIFAMQAAAATVQARFDSDAEGAREALARLRESGREAMAEMEAMLDSLRSTPLTMAGLVDALKKQGEALQFRSGADVSFHIGTLPPDRALAPGAQQAIFRVAQEAFANVGRHARASRVHVTLVTEGGQLVLRIEDDGSGFSTSGPAPGMGLANMRDRAGTFNGRLDVRSQPGAGTTITLALPAGESSRVDVDDYRRRVFIWGGVVVFIGTIALVNWLGGWSRRDLSLEVCLLAANLVIFLRVAIAYVKARKRAEVTPWIESPSHS